MAHIKKEVIQRMIEVGRASDLVEIMEGDSEYCTDSSENIPKTKDEIYNYGMALKHIQFIDKFGLEVQEVEENGYFFKAYPDYFERWLDQGCLGIFREDLMAYLKDHPL